MLILLPGPFLPELLASQIFSIKNVWNEEGIALARYNRGRADGRAEGMAEGANKANRENARKMKADGLSLELIAKYTSLSIEEIEAL